MKSFSDDIPSKDKLVSLGDFNKLAQAHATLVERVDNLSMWVVGLAGVGVFFLITTVLVLLFR